MSSIVPQSIPTPDSKVCTRCAVLKPVADYGRDVYSPDGLNYRCKACRRQSQAHLDNSARGKAWYQANKEKKRSKQRKNQEKRTAYMREWRKQLPRGADYFNRENERKRKWKRANLAKARVMNQRRRARARSSGGSYTLDEWTTLCGRYGNKCLACGSEGPLTVDHILPISSGGTSSIDNLQPLCKPCNTRKLNRYIDYRTVQSENQS
jgi:5-methylcytosine-specific restriction endonuclease McrA